MRISRRGLAYGAGAWLAGGRALAQPSRDAAMAPEGAPREIIPIWPRRPPGLARPAPREEVLERSAPPALRDRAVVHVARPVLIAFRPAEPNGAAIVLVPGGAYMRVVLDKEGFESAERFNEAGVTVFVLVYRLPGDAHAAGPDASLQDAQRAMRLVRARAGEFAIDPARVAVMGFSAGGHVAASLALRFDAPTYAPVDDTDALSARPDLALLLYPVVTMEPAIANAESRRALLGEAPSDTDALAYSLENRARAEAPPTFIAAAADDAVVPIENALGLYYALRRAGVASELHLFETGGHGFGLRFTVGKSTAAWPDLALAWMRGRGAV